MLYNPYALINFADMPRDYQRVIEDETYIADGTRFANPSLDVTIAAFGEQFIRVSGYRVGVTVVSLDPDTYEVRFNGGI